MTTLRRPLLVAMLVATFVLFLAQGRGGRGQTRRSSRCRRERGQPGEHRWLLAGGVLYPFAGTGVRRALMFALVAAFAGRLFAGAELGGLERDAVSG